MGGAVREHLFHLFDFDGTRSYMLYYRPDDGLRLRLRLLAPVPAMSDMTYNQAAVFGVTRSMFRGVGWLRSA